MRRIIPTIFATNKKEFNERFFKLIKILREIQIDFMDGKFVKTKGIRPSALPSLKNYSNKFEAHLMVKNPQKYISLLKKKGFKKVIFHFESLDKEKIPQLIEKIKQNKMQAWIAINPQTHTKKIIDFLPNLNGILLMGVSPGKEGQKFQPNVLEKAIQLRKLTKLPIQLDGGVTPLNIRKIFKSKVDIVNSGGFVANAENPKTALEVLMKA